MSQFHDFFAAVGILVPERRYFRVLKERSE